MVIPEVERDAEGLNISSGATTLPPKTTYDGGSNVGYSGRMKHMKAALLVGHKGGGNLHSLASSDWQFISFF